MKTASAKRGVLVVEDDSTIRDLVTQALGDEGYQALSARRAATWPWDARGHARGDLARPQMRDMDGHEFARYRRLLGPPAPPDRLHRVPVACRRPCPLRHQALRAFELDALLASRPHLRLRAATAARPNGSLPVLSTIAGATSNSSAPRCRTQRRYSGVQAETRRLASDGSHPASDGAETKQVATVRRESEALRLELARFHDQFQLREDGRPGGLSRSTTPSADWRPQRGSASPGMIL